MSELDDKISKMVADLAERKEAIEQDRAVVAAEQEEKRAAGVRALFDVAMPIIDEVKTSCDAQRVRYVFTEEFDGMHDPRITFQCNGRKARTDGSTYTVDGAELVISHNGEVLSVKIRRYPLHQKGPTEFVVGTQTQRIMAGLDITLNSCFIAMTPDK